MLKKKKIMATWNREEQSIVSDYQNGKIAERAVECARRNEHGFKHGWTVDQHKAALIAKAESLIASEQPQTKPSAQPMRNQVGFGRLGHGADQALAPFGFGE